MSEDILRKLLASFKAEYQDHLVKIRSILDALEKSGQGVGPGLEEAFRRAHSLKGASRAVDLRQVETLAHCVETIFARVREGRLPWDDRTLKTIRLVLDSVEDWLGAYFERKPPPELIEALNAVESLLGAEAAAGGRAPRPEPAEEPAAPPPAEDAVLVGVHALERLLKASGRVHAESARQDAVADRMAALEARVRGLADGPFGALKKEIRELRRAHARAAWGLKTAGESLLEAALRARMVTAESMLQGLRRLARELAHDEGKELELALEGLGVQADRLVLQALKDPLMHLLRNCVSHGIESPDQRRAAGKPAAGRIVLRLDAQGRRLRVSVSDDGRGVDWAGVRDCAVKRRHLAPDQAERASPEELSRLLFLPGFSTARMVTDLAGRGMGLSVVAESVKRLQGRVEFLCDAGGGVRVEISVPLSISARRLLILESGGQAFALAAADVDRLLRVSAGKIETIEGRSAIVVGERIMPVRALAGLLGRDEAVVRLDGDRVPVVVLKSPGGGFGLAVDAFHAETEAVVQRLQGGAEEVKAFSGAILDPDGAPVLVLDAAAILERLGSAEPGAIFRAEKAPPPKRPPSILVVDDSVTTRTLEKSLLEAHGYQVVLAVDGEEALRRLRSETVDLAIVDIQMPRMDGFQLIERMKGDLRLSKLPVIIVSSLESRGDKERGMALGADAYILKRKFDHKGLLEAIRQIL